MTATPITFVDAVARGFRGALDFRGRSSRREFWFWILFIAIVRMVTTTIDGFLYPADITANIDPTNSDQRNVSMLATLIQHSLASATFLVELLLLLPLVAITMRRLRDAGWKPWIAVAAYGLNYAGLVVALSLTTSSLSLLTSAGDALSLAQATDAMGIVAQMLGLILLDLGAMITLLVGTLQPSKPVTD